MFKNFYTKGLVIGKFMPPHRGHEYLIRFAQSYCQDLHVLVDCLEGQTISPERRVQWLQESFPDVHVDCFNQMMPQYPEETEHFWDIWSTAIQKKIGQPDVVVASMDYGWELASRLHCDFVPLDIARESFSISATEIRNAPFRHWDEILPVARPYFMKKICFLGPESTGKSTFVREFAQKLNTVYIPEYAQKLIEYQGGHFYKENINQVIEAQYRTEKAAEKMVNKVMLCDSSALTTKLWSQLLWGEIPEQIDFYIERNPYDYYFVLTPETPWVKDIHRDDHSNSEKIRWDMFHQFIQELDQMKAPYSVIKGDFEEKRIKINEELHKIYEENDFKKNKLYTFK